MYVKYTQPVCKVSFSCCGRSRSPVLRAEVRAGIRDIQALCVSMEVIWRLKDQSPDIHQHLHHLHRRSPWKCCHWPSLQHWTTASKFLTSTQMWPCVVPDHARILWVPVFIQLAVKVHKRETPTVCHTAVQWALRFMSMFWSVLVNVVITYYFTHFYSVFIGQINARIKEPNPAVLLWELIIATSHDISKMYDFSLRNKTVNNAYQRAN